MCRALPSPGARAVGGEGQCSGRQNVEVISEIRDVHVAGCVAVVASLPEWFGYEGALEGVEHAARTQMGFVEVERGTVGGFVTMAPLFPETVEITYLAVHADRRRSGVGRALVRVARDRAQRDGARSICLLTLGPSAGSAVQEETIAFYRALGFWRTKEVYLQSWRGAPTLLMSAPIDQIG
jgi:ribosomal protein S18 acetylase RimI-like enzyme